MGLDQPLADREPEARPPQALPALVAAGAGVLAEQARQPLRRHALALVGDRDGDVRAVALGRDPDGRGARRVPRGVGEQVAQHLHDARPVGQHQRQVLRQVDKDRVRGAAVLERLARLLHQPGDAGGDRRERERSRLDAARVEQVADQALHPVGLLVDDPEELVQLDRVERRRGAQHRRRSSP